MVTFILQVIALILLFAAGFNFTVSPKISVGWLGMAVWLLSLMLGGVVLHTAGH